MTAAHVMPSAGSIEQHAQTVARRIQAHEGEGREIAREVYALSLGHALMRLKDSGIPEFKPWLVSFGVPAGSVSYYLNIGTALAAHVEGVPDAAPAPQLSAADLRAAGSAIRAGAPVAEVQQAAQQGTVRDYANAHHHEGTVEIRLALPAKPTWDAQTTRWQALTGLPVMEVQALMVSALQFVTDDDVLTIARSGELT